MAGLAAAGVGWPMGVPGRVVPIVPGAVVFDLWRGSAELRHPGAGEGSAALAAAHAGPVEQGVVGAGTGASSGGFKGGVGSASVVLPSGTTVGAIVVVNSAGSAVRP